MSNLELSPILALINAFHSETRAAHHSRLLAKPREKRIVLLVLILWENREAEVKREHVPC